MESWALNQDGFIMNYMLAGPLEADYETESRDPNQLRLEAWLRKEIVTLKKLEVSAEVKVGAKADNGCDWTVYYSYGNCFVDRSKFYSTLAKVRMALAAVLYAPEDMDVRAVLWTYMSVGVYCNGSLVGEQDDPIYKPIHHKEMTLPLKKGRNLLYFDCENLGVRDTRNIVGMQILDRKDEIRVQLADEEYQERVQEAEEFLDNLKVKKGVVRFSSPAPKGAKVCFPPNSVDYEEMQQPWEWKDIEGCTEVTVPESVVHVQVGVDIAGAALRRNVEVTEHHRPMHSPEGISCEENYRLAMERLAGVGCSNRDVFGFAISNILARRYLDKTTEHDRELFLAVLDVINKRVDCSDFQLCGLLRYMHNYEMDEEMKARTKDVLLNYRYWMNMDGADAMCFWSENHALLFYVCAMDAGSFYPNDYFVRAKMTGRELRSYGRKKVMEWLDDVEEYGFEEFLSTVYMCVTFMGLLNVVDFAEEEISRRAQAVTDKMFETLCDQTFKGCVVAPMGRVYRGVLYPFSQGTQALMNLVDPTAPYTYGEGWLGSLLTSKYRLPDGLRERMRGCVEKTYTSGNARIMLEKNEDYCLTSVQSPREAGYERWRNIQRDEDADRDTHEYTKSLNECFHGTTNFGPGVFGYQQHMWYAALDGEAVIFVNHPASSSEATGMRPGYWNGNGVMPAVSQVHGRLGAVYEIPDTYPIHFTHVYCPTGRFEEVSQDGSWLFFKKGSGYLALWCSQELAPHDDVIFDCELRAYGDTMAYFCVCGREKDHGDFPRFMEFVRGQQPAFDADSKTLTAADGYCLTYRKCQDDTQYVE